MKKISLFLATPVRQRMEKDPEFVRNPALLKAIRLHHELIEASLKGGLEDEIAKSIGGCSWKLFSCSHCCSAAV